MSRGTGLTLIGSRFDPDTRRLLEVLARNRLVWNWLDLEASPEAAKKFWPCAAIRLKNGSSVVGSCGVHPQEQPIVVGSGL